MKKIYILVLFVAAQLQGAASGGESLVVKFTRLAQALTGSNEGKKMAAATEIYTTPRLLNTIELRASQDPRASSPSAQQLHEAALKIKAHLPTGQTTEKESVASKMSRHASIVKHSLEGDFDQMEQEIRENPGYRSILKKAAAGDSAWKNSQKYAQEVISYLKYRPEFEAEFK